MIIRIQQTDEQLALNLHQLGYKTMMLDVPVAVTTAHNQTEIENYPRLHVLVAGKWVLAQMFFEKFLNESLLFIMEIFKNYKSISND